MKVRKNDGKLVEFDKSEVRKLVSKLMLYSNNNDLYTVDKIVNAVTDEIHNIYKNIVDISAIHNIIEDVLLKNGLWDSARKAISRRENKTNLKDNAVIEEIKKLFESYLHDMDWRISENSNMTYSINGLNNYVREKFTSKYWLYEIYTEEIRNAHIDGRIHIHDLGFFGTYCAGWDCNLILMNGFGGVATKPEFAPPKHLRTFLGQIVNSTFTTQGESAGAQAWSSIDTYAAPFIYYDNLSYKEVKQAVQEYVCQMNVPTRVGFQCPFSNQTHDIVCPNNLKDRYVIVGGEIMDKQYGDFQKEMDMFNKAFCEVMEEGDLKGRVFTFPIPTINITKDIDWDSEIIDGFMRLACKYGIPYFANYINADISPEDSLSMCCRLRLDLSELKKRGGGLFGSNPLTGSIGVVTINLPNLGYISKTEDEFFNNLYDVMVIAKKSLEIKRDVVEKNSDMGMYPYSTNYLSGVKMRTGKYWTDHFSTIGLIGMNECLLNLFGYDITTQKGQAFAIKTLNYMRDVLKEFQDETGNIYNLEATPAESASYSLAKKDLEKYPDIIHAGKDVPYYTNSTQLPVNYTNDIFEYIELNDELQSLYTGGTVLHLYLGEALPDTDIAKKIIRSITDNYKLPYISLTPTFSVCDDHGYISGEHEKCPKCGKGTEVWSRVVGYLRPRSGYNIGKKEEARERVYFKI